MKDLKKITVLGDIMVEPPLLAQAGHDGAYDFHRTFEPIGDMLSAADYVIANLETPLAGPGAGYTDCLVSFNAPDSLAGALKDVGVDLVTTANNHCLDRGYDGLARTLDVLDRAGLAHTGTFREGDSGDRFARFSVGPARLAVVSCTYGTNYGLNHQCLEGDRAACVNYLRPCKSPGMGRPLPPAFGKVRTLFRQLAGRGLTWEEEVLLKKAMEIPVAYADDVFSPEEEDRNLVVVERDYRLAREKADLVFFCPHVGGQFNTRPGAYSSHVVERAARIGFDAVFAAHSHTTQKAEYLGAAPCFYSLGNVTMTPSSIYSVAESLPQYGLACHLYLSGTRIHRTTFSLLKMVEREGSPLRVIPADGFIRDLSGKEREETEREVSEVVARVAGYRPDPVIQSEYELPSGVR